MMEKESGREPRSRGRLFWKLREDEEVEGEVGKKVGELKVPLGWCSKCGADANGVGEVRKGAGDDFRISVWGWRRNRLMQAKGK
jgi:hypothetical protein